MQQPQASPPQQDWLTWARRLQAIAQIGLTYARDPFDIERYEQIRAIAVEIAAARTGADPQRIADIFTSEKGYATPKVDVRGLAVRDGRVLMVREASDGRWTLPGGWADIGDSPAEAVVREIREESGYEARAVRLLAVYDRDQAGYPAYEYAVYKVFFLCEITGGEAAISHETSGVDWFTLDDLPPLSEGRILPEQLRELVALAHQPDAPTAFN